MNMVDLLLKADQGKLAKPQKKVEIKRLTEALGEKAQFLCEALSADIYSEIQQRAINMDSKGNIKEIEMGEMQAFVILEGVKDPSFKTQELMNYYGVATPIDLIKKLLLPGELTFLFNIINDLSGFGNSEEQVEDIKN